ncbi:heavy-metal-associated domain-containing protein [Streptococcus merionis]|uniref:heavy-metal-associated domain-containing protein n=1 Tax=Streptococcus merionis TaxID=400065 RepID=UPI003515AE18
MKQTLTIDKMSCDHCVARVTAKLSQIAGVEDVAIDLEKAQAVVTTRQEHSQADYQQALDKTIYKVVDLS